MNRNNLCHAVRQSLIRLPSPFEAHYGVVRAPPPKDALPLGNVRAEMDAAREAMVKVRAMAREMPDPWRLTRIITRREAVASSAIEGTYSTLNEVLSLEEGADDSALNAARQVRSYALALDHLIPAAQQQGTGIFNIGLIQSLHQAVMRDDPDYSEIPGALRQGVVWIGGSGDIAQSTFNPPPPEGVAPCLADTIDYLQNQGMQRQTQNLLTRMAIAHAHFESVHPFKDGNGRVGRLLLPLMMAADGEIPLYLSPFIEARKAWYYDGLKAAQQRLEWSPLVGFLAEAVVASVAELADTSNALRNLHRLWQQRQPFRAKSGAARTLDLLSVYPVLTINRLAAELGISFVAASRAIRQLVNAGILTERTGYRRNRLFVARDVLAILNRPFGSTPELPEG
jgi:Fic family protein